ncbi:MAG: hypothetical protein ACK6DZ_23855 [Acidobacteriota bacterium]
MTMALLLLTAQVSVPYWTGEHPKAQLAEWAMEHWARGSEGLIQVRKVAREQDAEIRFRFMEPARRGLYGQNLTHEFNGRVVNEVVINPAMSRGEPDALLAEVILFLTCVHESGHALGPEHTRNFADIMYSFQYGGDLASYFERYRQRLKSAADMKSVSPLSANDVKQIKAWALRRQRNESRSGESAPSPPR